MQALETEGGDRDSGTRRDGPRWYARSTEDVLAELDTDPEHGLSSDEARQRLAQHGPNRIREQEEVSPWRILLDQFTSPLIYVLLAALAVTVAIQSWSDVIVIAAVLVINGTIGFVQEYRAESAVQSLMRIVSPEASVVRDGRRRQVDAEHLVPGDVVELSQGAVVPADVRLVGTEGLRVNEAPLTGESVPVDKITDPIEDAALPPADQRNMAFMSTAVTSGSGRGVVSATGPRTEIGHIAEQVEEASGSETPLQLRIDRLARWIAVAILGVGAVAFLVGVLIGRDVIDMLLLAVALGVAAIPAGLPVVVTVALAIGVRRMTAREAVIRNLHAVDTLGSCSTILSDKTGTLTRNEMTVRAVVAGGRRYEVGDEDGGTVRRDGDTVAAEDDPVLRAALLAGLLCNDAEAPGDGNGDAPPTGDPMEIALVEAGVRGDLSPSAVRQEYRRRETVPFRTARRYMATVHDDPEGDGPLVVVKGAPERVAPMCTRQRDDRGEDVDFDADAAIERSDELAREGFRVLAVAVGRGQEAADGTTAPRPPPSASRSASVRAAASRRPRSWRARRWPSCPTTSSTTGCRTWTSSRGWRRTRSCGSCSASRNVTRSWP